MDSRISRRSLLAAAAGVLAVAAAAAAWWAGRPARHLRAAEAAADAGDLGAALGLLKVPEASPATRPRALLLRARVAVERGDLKGAVAALDAAGPHPPDPGAFAYWKGRTLFAAKQPALALEWLDRAAAAGAGGADAHRWRAAAAYDLGDRAAARAALEAAVKLDPDDPRLWRTMGLTDKENLDYERARDAFRRSLKLDRAQPEVRLDLAECLVKLGDVESAARELAACKGRVGEGRRAELLAECDRVKGDAGARRAAVDAGLAAEPSRPGLLAARGQIALAEGRPEEALALFDRAAAADPYRAETFYQRSLAHRRLGRDASARADAARASGLNAALEKMSVLNDRAAAAPRDPDVRAELGAACAALGKFELAASWYRAALALRPGHDAARRGLIEVTAAAAREPGGR